MAEGSGRGGQSENPGGKYDRGESYRGKVEKLLGRPTSSTGGTFTISSTEPNGIPNKFNPAVVKVRKAEGLTITNECKVDVTVLPGKTGVFDPCATVFVAAGSTVLCAIADTVQEGESVVLDIDPFVTNAYPGPRMDIEG